MSNAPTIQVELPDFVKTMSVIPAVLIKSIRSGLKRQVVEVHKLAMRKHRHITRTGTLNSSLQRKVADDGLSGDVYFETGIAKYGPFVHEGHHSWKPDRFLYEALAAREQFILADMEKAINDGLVAAGLK
jgi:hypothetical protein